MKKDVETVVLTEALYHHWHATTGFCGPCCAMQGAIDKACAKAGEVYVFYRHENHGDTTYSAYAAEGIGPFKDVEAIQAEKALATYGSLREAKKSPYRAAFDALHKYVKEQQMAEQKAVRCMSKMQ